MGSLHTTGVKDAPSAIPGLIHYAVSIPDNDIYPCPSFSAKT